ncbi:MAG: LamG domain-containing protein [Phycisphaerales bacterium]|nr:MAG: LamG domain-containing protein [Phycisphaerales bacterium]
MVKTTFRFAIAVLLLLIVSRTGLVLAQDLPVHAGTRVLRSGGLVVEVGDPNSPECRWNRGLRFSPVANVLRVQLNGQEFLYSPVDGGVVSPGYVGGLPMEFDIGQEEFQPDPPGYVEGTSGSSFLKIGVGILRRNSSAYNFMTNYDVIELADTAATWHSDRVHFAQTLSGTANGYSYALEEDVIVKNDRIIMNYVLTNTGSKTFTTEQYIHNFLTFSGKPVGPDYIIGFPYNLTSSPEIEPWSPPVRRLSIASTPQVVRLANMIIYKTRVTSVPKIWVYKPEDYAGRDLFGVEQTDTAQRLVIESSLPAEYVGIWTTDYQVSPEQFLIITLAPGEHIEFTRTYVFQVDDFIRQDCTGDGTVDACDVSAMSVAWLSKAGDTKWDPGCDIGEPADDEIDLVDLAALASCWRRNGTPPAPVAYWPLDETGGSSAVDSANDHVATLHNFPTDDSQWVAGAASGGLQFDGVDDYVEANDYHGVTGKSPRTVVMWIRTATGTQPPMALLAWGQASPGSYWQLAVDSNRRLKLDCDAGTIVAGKAVGDTQWHHVAAVLDPIDRENPHVSDVRLYVDGMRQPVDQLIECEIDTAETGALRMGRAHYSETDSHFGGTIDDVRVYNRPLSGTDIQHIYAGTDPWQGP